MDELWEDDVGDEELLQVEITYGFQGKLGNLNFKRQVLSKTLELM